MDGLLADALALIQAHNSSLGPIDPDTKIKPNGYVDPATFPQAVRAMGGTTDDRLKEFSWEDILECMTVTGPIKPRILAKDIAKVFRGKDGEVKKHQVISEKRVGTLTIPELVAAYDPNFFDLFTPVGKKLKDISKGQPFMVFADPVARILDVEESTRQLTELARGLPPQTTITYKGDIRKVYAIGEAMESFMNENPLYHGRALRTNDVCDQTGRSWQGVPLEVRQLIYLAVQNGELKVNIDKAHDTLDLALTEDAAGKLRTRYRQAALKFDELKATGKLPSMTIQVNPSSGTLSGPLSGGRRVNL